MAQLAAQKREEQEQMKRELEQMMRKLQSKEHQPDWMRNRATKEPKDYGGFDSETDEPIFLATEAARREKEEQQQWQMKNEREERWPAAKMQELAKNKLNSPLNYVHNTEPHYPCTHGGSCSCMCMLCPTFNEFILKDLREKHTFIDKRLNTNHCHTTCEHGKSCCCICNACGPVGVCVQMLDKTDTIARGTEAERRESTNQKNLCYMMRQVSIEEESTVERDNNDSHEIILDSGATSHFIQNDSPLIASNSVAKQHRGVVTGLGGKDHKMLRIIDTVHIPLKQISDHSSAAQALRLSNVKTIEKTKSIVSIGQLCTDTPDCITVFDEDEARVYASVESVTVVGNLIATATLTDGLYILDTQHKESLKAEKCCVSKEV